MKCQYCGTELPEDAPDQLYCTLCGARLTTKIEKEKPKQKEEVKKLISFRRAELNQREIDVLDELEFQTEHVFNLVEDVQSSATMSFSIANNHITGINLYWCELETLPEMIEDFTYLEYLYISDNDLKNLPQSIGNLKSLKHLNLHCNKITLLPESIGNLTLLEYLNLWGNELRTLPESIGNMVSLQKANFGSNRLVSLPESIGNLTSLKALQLFSNELQDLPESILKLKTLRILDIRNNPWKKERFGTTVLGMLLAELVKRGGKIKK
jgi:Leucine-rich repeat (LRR) protein